MNERKQAKGMRDHVPNITEKADYVNVYTLKGTQEIHRNQPRVILAGLINITHRNPSLQLYKPSSTSSAPVDKQPSLLCMKQQYESKLFTMLIFLKRYAVTVLCGLQSRSI